MRMDTDLIKATIEHYGKTVQSVVCMEECCELAQAVSKEMRGKPDKQHLAEEMADVLICIEMLKQMLPVENMEQALLRQLWAEIVKRGGIDVIRR